VSGNFARPRRDHVQVTCETCREALSARMDAEEEPAPSDRVEEHLAGCQSCRRWQHAAAGLTRTLRVRPAEHTPDLTDQILAAASVPAGQPRRATLRWALGGVAFIQLVLGLAQLLGVDHTGHLAAGDGSQHLFNESTAWNLGLAVGFRHLRRFAPS
jgi:predicted anti-sigma-YlaC factor YlaD